MFEKLQAAVGGRQLHPRSEAFLASLEEIALLHLKKGSDYGRDDDPFANISQSAQWGIAPWLGAMMRAGDKVVRLQTYARTGTLSNEGAEDAALDLASYATIALVLLRDDRTPNPQTLRADDVPVEWVGEVEFQHDLTVGDRVVLDGDLLFDGYHGRVLQAAPAHVLVSVDGVGPSWVMAQHAKTVHPDT